MEPVRRIETGAPGRRVVWHVAGNGPILVLLHGGYGSWTHWIRNIWPLAQHMRVLAPDTPGLGDSDMVEPLTLETLAAPICAGLEEIVGTGQRINIAGFSFGATVAAGMLNLIGPSVDRLIVLGGGGLGVKRSQMAELESWRHLADEAAIRAVHRRNLALLMLHDHDAIDEAAVDYQRENTRRARVQSRGFSGTDSLRRALVGFGGEVHGIWGEEDATARDGLAAREAVLKSADPDGQFLVVPKAGHWVQYEAAAVVNAALIAWTKGAPRSSARNT